MNGDDDIPVCNDLDNKTWEENFLHHLGQEAEPEEDEEEGMQVEPLLSQ